MNQKTIAIYPTKITRVSLWAIAALTTAAGLTVSFRAVTGPYTGRLDRPAVMMLLVGLFDIYCAARSTRTVFLTDDTIRTRSILGIVRELSLPQIQNVRITSARGTMAAVFVAKNGRIRGLTVIINDYAADDQKALRAFIARCQPPSQHPATLGTLLKFATIYALTVTLVIIALGSWFALRHAHINRLN